MDRPNSHMNEDPRYLSLKGHPTNTSLTSTNAFSQPLYGVYGEENIYVKPSDAPLATSSSYSTSSLRCRSGHSSSEYAIYGSVPRSKNSNRIGQQRQQHRLEPVYFLTPILCPHCNDYIWGNGRIGVQCRECRECFHNVCSLYSGRVPCERRYDSHTPPPATMPNDTPISDWSCSNVAYWLASVHLSLYMEIFQSKDIKGPELLSLDKEKLGYMGIKEELAQDTILDCIEQLQGRGTRSTESFQDSELTESHEHKLCDTSFPKLVLCKKCGGYLKGLFHQGQVCEVCNIVLHRTCAATGLKTCKGRQVNLNRFLHSKFGLSLCTQFPSDNRDAPPFLQLAFHTLIAKAQKQHDLDLYALFRMPPNDVEVAMLRKSCDEDLESVHFSAYKAHVIAHLIKRYLVELPDPVIPSSSYDCLMTAANRYQNDEQFATIIKNTLVEISDDKPHHFTTLRFLMVQLLKLCNIQVSKGYHYPPTILIQSLSHILLRPPWEKVIDLARNTEAHMRVLEVMLLKEPWGERVPFFPSAPALPPKSHKTASIPPQVSAAAEVDSGGGIGAPSPPPLAGHSIYAGAVGVRSKASIRPKIPAEAPQSLVDAPWYWGAINRDAATALMKDTTDGSYLVRDASTGNNNYTLTLRKGGSNKLIKICHSSGKYGFAEPYAFDSVASLIEFCYDQNLMQFNESLDIRLLHGVNRTNYCGDRDSLPMSADDLTALLNEVTVRYNEKQEEYVICKEKQAVYERRLEYSNECLTSFKFYVETYHEHVKRADHMITEAQPHEVEELKKNRKVLETRSLYIKAARDEHEMAHIALTKRGHNEERQCRSLKGEVGGLFMRLEELTADMHRRGVSTDEDFLHYDAAKLAELEDRRLWFNKQCTRIEAERLLLREKKDGTFLVRMAQSGSYALSIFCCGEVQHCLIYKGEGFGFAEPFLIYKTLEELVLHYSRHSLVMHNDLLQTTLKYPAFKLGHSAIT